MELTRQRLFKKVTKEIKRLLEQKFTYPEYDYFIIFTLYKTENTKNMCH